MAKLQRAILAALVATVIFSVVVAAQDDDDERPEGDYAEGQQIREVSEGVDAEEAAEDISDEADTKEDSSGLRAHALFPKYADLRVPAGERIEVLVAVSNAPGNPSYEIAIVAGSLAVLDHSRFIQNFSAQAYSRTVAPGETATLKYTVTPDAMLDPNEYAFVVSAYVRTDANSSLMQIAGYNGTMTVTDPLGFDFKGLLTAIAFIGGTGAGVWYYMNKKQASRPAPRRAPQPAAAVETGTKNTAYDPEFIDRSHMKYFENKNRNRSASK
jgi:hypothetical protein